MKAIRAVIVIGASAGGLRTITKLISGIRLHPGVAIFVVLHVAKTSSADVIVNHLQKSTGYKCLVPADGHTISGGHLYIAGPDYHLLVNHGMVRVIKGPHENKWRPSIDVLFRSAAVAYDTKVIGIILTGLLDDGTAGMYAIKKCGGVCIVQEPTEAEFSDMPTNVLNKVDVDYQVSISDIGYILEDIYSKPRARKTKIPDEIRMESKMTEQMVSKIEDLEKLGRQSNYTCPDCGGSLWAVKNDPAHRYRCFTGHAYTERLLLEKQAEKLVESLWVSIRILEEHENLLEDGALYYKDLGNREFETEYRQKKNDVKAHIERLKAFAVAIGNDQADTLKINAAS